MDDAFPDGSALEYRFCNALSYAADVDDINDCDPDDLERLIAEGYVIVDKRKRIAMLTAEGWDWCRYERGRNRAYGDSFSGPMPLFMSKEAFAERVGKSLKAVERASISRIAPAVNSIGYIDYNLALDLWAIPDQRIVYFEAPGDAYPRPKEISRKLWTPGGWVYVPYIRPLFRLHELQIEYCARDWHPLDEGIDEDLEQTRPPEHFTEGLVYGPRGHIAVIRLDDDGTLLMPWDTAAAILRDHAGVEMTYPMIKATWPENEFMLGV